MNALIYNDEVLDVSKNIFDVSTPLKWIKCSKHVKPGWKYENGIFIDPFFKSEKQLLIERDIDIGNKIKDELFNTNIYSQLGLIRKSIWALNVLRKENSTAEDIDKAENILFQAEEIDKQIEEILKPQSL